MHTPIPDTVSAPKPDKAAALTVASRIGTNNVPDPLAEPVKKQVRTLDDPDPDPLKHQRLTP